MRTFEDLFKSLDNIVGAAQHNQKVAEEESTSHATGSADAGTRPAAEGSHGSELDTQVKSQVGPQTTNAAAPTPDAQPRPDKGTTVTGPDQAPPEGQPKGKPDEPGTSHPAKGDAGEKYANWDPKKIGEVANSILAQLSVMDASSTKKAEQTPAAPVTASTAEQAGREAAAKVAAQVGTVPATEEQMNKGAEELVAHLINAADNMADKVVSYAAGLRDGAIQKQAEEEAAAAAAPPMAPPGGGEMPMGDPMAGGGDEGDDMAALEAIVQQASAELGIPPEQVIQMLIEELMAGGGAGAGAGGEEMAAAAPAAPPMAPPAEGMTAAASQGASKTNNSTPLDDAQMKKLASGLVTLIKQKNKTPAVAA